MGADNVHAAGLEATGQAYKDAANKAADEQALIASQAAAKEQELIKQRDLPKGERADKELKELESIKGEFTTASEKRRTDADKIFSRQDELASRQANMAAAQAGESGLTMSE